MRRILILSVVATIVLAPGVVALLMLATGNA
jgi:hypothetical protein